MNFISVRITSVYFIGLDMVIDNVRDKFVEDDLRTDMLTRQSKMHKYFKTFYLFFILSIKL